MSDTMTLPDAMAIVRQHIGRAEARIAALPESWHGDTERCPLRHSFGDQTYMREIFIPRGTILTGKIHRQTHPYFLLTGEALVITEHDGAVYMQAPLAGISQAGVKRFIYAVTDLWWVTIHYNEDNTRDLAVLESRLIAPSYEDLAP